MRDHRRVNKLFSMGALLFLLCLLILLPSCGKKGKGEAPSQQPVAPVSEEIKKGVRVELRWDEPTNLNLELWDQSGAMYLHPASQLESPDVKLGGDGFEFIEFKQFPNPENLDLSLGSWSVFVGHPFGFGEVEARVTIIFPGGERREIRRIIPGEAYHWEICTVFPEEGRVDEVDRMHYNSRY